MVFETETLPSFQEQLRKPTQMKINEVTGLAGQFARSLGANVARQIGATATADAILKGMGTQVLPIDSPTFFKDTAKVAKTVLVLAAVAKRAGGIMSASDIGAVLSKKLPAAWKSESNKSAVINAFADELAKQGVKIGNTPVLPQASPDEPISIGGEVISPSNPLYAKLKAQASQAK
jgi:hypothetical protein